MLKKSLIPFSALLLVQPACSKPVEKPNILFILIDDLGYTSLSCYGNRLVQTPNIDRLATNGIKFTNGYVTPQSTPSRACLLTGQYTARNRMWHVIPYYGFPWARVTEPEFEDNLPREEATLAELIKTAGYTTAILGKWHLSTYENDGYYTYLFEDKAHYYGFDYVNPRHDPPEYQSVGDKGVDFLTSEAISFMERNIEKPFFIYLSHHTIHNPVLAPEPLVKKYLDAGYPSNGLHSAVYLAALEHLDNSVGRLLDKLDKLRLTDNTIIFFISDNGGVDANFDNYPLRYGKGSAYEGGIRVPFIVCWPGVIKPGTISNIPVHIVDIYPTLAEITGAEIPANHISDGLSLLPVFSGNKKAGKKLASRPLYFYQPLYDIQWGATPSASIIKGNYKLIHFFGDYIDLDEDGKYIPEGRTELYDLSNDIGESNDLGNVKPELRDRMLNSLYEWIRSQGAEIPGINDRYDITRWNQRSNTRID